MLVLCHWFVQDSGGLAPPAELTRQEKRQWDGSQFSAAWRTVDRLMSLAAGLGPTVNDRWGKGAMKVGSA